MKKAIKIAVVGPESTGKTELSKQLAEHYQSEWVPEMARTYLENLSRQYDYDDLEKIALQQLEAEEKLSKQTGELLICDTNLIVIKVWSDFKFGKTEPWIIEKIREQDYLIHLLMDIDMPWQYDPLREHPHKRQELFDIYVRELKFFNIPFQIISGTGMKRLDHAVKAIDQTLQKKVYL